MTANPAPSTPFDPSRMREASQYALSGLLDLPAGWYRLDVVAGALALASGLTPRWFANALQWAVRTGSPIAMRGRREKLVWIDPPELRDAWPVIAGRAGAAPRLDVRPVGTEAAA